MNIADIKKIYVQRAILNNQKIQNVIAKTDVEVQLFDDIKEVPSHYFDKKKAIIFAEQKGVFLKKCPCTPNYLGCEYWVVELSIGCLYDCTYCYLQEYQNISATAFYVNFEKLYQEFDELLGQNPDKLYRIGFGEYADSLFLDELMNYTNEISDYLSKHHKNYLIEYKTKSNNISNLLKFKPTGKEVIGWTINTLKISESEEKHAGNFFERLEAMKKCADKGYFVAVHFDPVIYYDGWADDYKFIIDEIFNKIDKNKIIWISIGS
jgi:spore photoproduct lyase